MSLSALPLSYCTNVHPGRSVPEIESGLDRYAVPIRARFDQPLAAGLWLARPVVTELLSSPDGVARFVEGLARRGLTCHTLNAFPYGDFHSPRVKENVYLPDWSQPLRLEYTDQGARVLASLLAPGTEGSISTLPLGFKQFAKRDGFLDVSAGRLIDCAASLDRLFHETGKLIRLAVEPEPFCELETTPEAIAFFERLWRAAEVRGMQTAVRTHIGLCFDICHQAVEFEDVAACIEMLDRAALRINKVHISCALQIDDPADNPKARAALRRYVEPRYLHQTIAELPGGRFARAVDLSDELIDQPGPGFSVARRWRVHFHVPVDAERLGPLATTRPALRHALKAVSRLEYAPHLEVETYTWEVLPGTGPADLVEGLARELTATRKLLAECG